MATNKTIYIGSQAIGPDKPMTVNGISGAVTLNVVDPLDWGAAPKEVFGQPRPSYGDGEIVRGRRWKPRSGGQVNIGGQVNTRLVGLTNREGYRDDAWEQVLDLLSPAGLTEWKVTRTNAAGTAVARVLRSEVEALPSWKWSPDQYGPGFVGRYDGPHFVVPASLYCPFPWWIDATGNGPQTEREETISGSPGGLSVAFTVAAGKDLGAGVQVAVYADSSITLDLGFEITSVSGPSFVGGGSAAMTNVTIGPGSAAIVDSYYSDPLEIDFFLGTPGASSGTSLWDNLVPGTRDLMAYKGSNTIDVAWDQNGAPITVEVRWKGWWGTP